MAKKLYYDYLTQDNQSYFLIATEKGLCFLGCVDMDEQYWGKWKQKYYGEFTVIHSSKALESYVTELSTYLDKKKKCPSISIDLEGTAFQREVWHALQTIPYGEVSTYSSIATQINRPKAVRAVANAISANPLLIFIPCHRVIGKNGGLTGFRSGIDVKKKLLELESRR
ncbi:methylated-DNA--[protein]-cysteine S-methyltransferase [Paraliobacillus salinarum]|uniref:methylated-DNA--[protein]-cysteine S-methyltransferase n=1 Tax=Paraliobacillus salinarum TaxID=1158996 RepID=UPI0015F4CDAD|nr:methylated-DNA--[protein]-cysteine S-methyltransferase [Paraliobacillus salinarum]